MRCAAAPYCSGVRGIVGIGVWGIGDFWDIGRLGVLEY